MVELAVRGCGQAESFLRVDDSEDVLVLAVVPDLCRPDGVQFAAGELRAGVVVALRAEELAELVDAQEGRGATAAPV